METKIEETQFFPLSSHYIPILCHQAKLYSQQSGTLRNSATSLEVRSKAILGQVQPKDLATIMDHSDLRRTGANSEGELVIWVLLVSTNKNPKILG